jgi:DNA-binding transcriptional MerR regulator
MLFIDKKEVIKYYSVKDLTNIYSWRCIMEYTISEVADKFNISIPTIRYYDKLGLLPLLKRNKGNVRTFSEADFDFLRMIEILKITGMELKDIRRYFYWCYLGNSTLKKRYDMFLERKKQAEEQINALKKSLQMIEYKCEYYKLANELGTTDHPSLEDICKPVEI